MDYVVRQEEDRLESMRDFAELLRGIAALIWPLLLIVFVLLFQEEIRALIKRIRRAKLLGQELELDQELDRLEAKTEAAREASLEVLTSPSEQSSAETMLEGDEADVEILRTAAASPKAALMLLSAEMEAQMRRLLASAGHLPRRPLNISQMSRELIRVAGLPHETTEAVAEFSHIRNRLVHGRDVREDEVLRAIDIGLKLLDILRDLPVPRYAVAQAGLPVYEDARGEQHRPDVTAVVLKVEGEEGARVYPTTQQYQAGERLSWDWNMDRVWGESWYLDVDTGEIKYAWRTSAEFVGKPLDQI